MSRNRISPRTGSSVALGLVLLASACGSGSSQTGETAAARPGLGAAVSSSTTDTSVIASSTVPGGDEGGPTSTEPMMTDVARALLSAAAAPTTTTTQPPPPKDATNSTPATLVNRAADATSTTGAPVTTGSTSAPSTTGAPATTAAPTTTTTAAPDPIANPVRIMPLGDSITERPEYRLQLVEQLLAGGCSVDLLGSQIDQGFVDISEWLDPNHEGHGGLRADEIAANTATWARSAPPEIVLLHVGTNDLYQDQSPANVVGDIRDTISALRSVNPNVTVLVAQIIPGVGIESLANDLNGQLVSMKNALDWADSRVFLVDQNSGFDVEADTWDKVHPNQSGGLKMANRWMATLRPLIADACTEL